MTKVMLKVTTALAVIGCLSAAAVRAETVLTVTQVSYDFRDKPVCTAVRMNPATYGALPASACTLGAESPTYGADRIIRNSYDWTGQLTQVDEAYGTPIQRAYARYTYTNNGRKTTEKDANGNLTTFEYDGFDRLKKLRFPNTTIGAGTSSTTDYEEYAYDSNGNKIWSRVRDGRALNFQYDGLNRQITKYASDASIRSVHTIYNLTGRIVYRHFDATNGPGVSYTYDGLGRVTTTTDLNGRTIGYAYNVASARISLIHPDLVTIGLGLDNANRLSSIGWNATSGLLTQSYDNLGRLSGEGKLGGATSYGYDGIGRLVAKTNDVANAAHDISWTFAYNPAGQIWSSSASTTVFDYDQTTGSTVNTTFDGLNRDTGIVSVSGYDARGNLTYEGTGGRTMTYDIENRLLTVTGASINMALTYDPEGRLSRYSADGGSTWTEFLYDGVNLIGEYAGTSATPLRRYVHGSGTDNPLLWLEGTGTSSVNWYYTNHQGSIVYVADAYGQGNALYRYDPYGVPTDMFNNLTWSGSRFRYTGQTMLQEARLYYYKARVYDPGYGRFLQTDPIGGDDDLNLYAYVKGDPVNKTDPTGTDGVGLTVGGNAEIGAGFVGGAGNYSGAAMLFEGGETAIIEQKGAALAVQDGTKDTDAVLGGSAGVGIGITYTNADSAQQMADSNAKTASVSTPWGAVSYSRDKKTGVIIVSATVGPGVGASVSNYASKSRVVSRSDGSKSKNPPQSKPARVNNTPPRQQKRVDQECTGRQAQSRTCRGR